MKPSRPPPPLRLMLFITSNIIQVVNTWKLLYSEDFSSPELNDMFLDHQSWVRDDYSEPFDTIMDDPGTWYENDYGPAWNEALDSFHTYRKEHAFGQDNWLTASLSARDWNKDGILESPPSLQVLTGAALMNVPDHTGGVLLRNTFPLPAEYRIEYKLMTLNFGGKRNGQLEYDGKENGYSVELCKTMHPWGEGSDSEGWSGDASVPYCEWQGVRRGPYAYNGFHFMTIVDFANPAPRNNHFWHYRRKVLMDAFSKHPDRVGDGSGGRMCNSNTGSYYDYRDSSFNTVNMWISGLPTWKRGSGDLAGNSQWFMTICSNGVAERELSTAAELQPELMPNEYYAFAIERNSTGYTLEASGNFARVGTKTLRFHRPFIDEDNNPIWHYNVLPEEYDGRFNDDLVQEASFGSTTWPDQWPEGSAYPDFFVIGALYTNVYEGNASLTDVRFYVADDATLPPTPEPTPASTTTQPTTSASTTESPPTTSTPSNTRRPTTTSPWAEPTTPPVSTQIPTTTQPVSAGTAKPSSTVPSATETTATDTPTTDTPSTDTPPTTMPTGSTTDPTSGGTRTLVFFWVPFSLNIVSMLHEVLRS